LAKGHSNSAIAKRLGVTTDTVKKTLTSSYGKLKARNRVEAARKFLESERT
jgi:DNA-binding NarL/FixJ family response regulator